MTVSASTKWAVMLMPSNTHKHQICAQVTMSSWSRKRQSTPYTNLPYVITHKKGNMITTQCGDKDAWFSLSDKEEDDNIGKIMPSTPQLIQQQPSLQSQSPVSLPIHSDPSEDCVYTCPDTHHDTSKISPQLPTPAYLKDYDLTWHLHWLQCTCYMTVRQTQLQMWIMCELSN